jgi:hypothetical protein
VDAPRAATGPNIALAAGAVGAAIVGAAVAPVAANGAWGGAYVAAEAANASPLHAVERDVLAVIKCAHPQDPRMQ